VWLEFVVTKDFCMNYEMNCGPSYRTWNVTYSMDLVDRSSPITVITKQVKCAIFSTLKFGTLTSVVFACLQHNSNQPSASEVIGTCIICCCLARTNTFAVTSSAIFDQNFANAFFRLGYLLRLLLATVLYLLKIVLFYAVFSET
jgi:hypothetical protein